MESSKRIFVVLSTILFLEASTHNSFSKIRPDISTNGNFNRPINGPAITSQPLGSQGFGLNRQNNFKNNNQAANSYQQDFGASLGGSKNEFNRFGSSNSGHGSDLTTGSNHGQRTAINNGINNGRDYSLNSGLNQFTFNRDLSNGHESGLKRGINNGQDATIFSGSNRDHGSAFNGGINNGYESDLKRGINSGHDSSIITGSNRKHVSGFNNGINNGHVSGFNSGINNGHVSGFNSGINSGQDTAISSGLNNEHRSDFNSVINKGHGSSLNSGINSGQDTTIFSGLNNEHKSDFNSGINKGRDTTVFSGLNQNHGSAFNSGINNGYESDLKHGINSGIGSTIIAGPNREHVPTFNNGIKTGLDSTIITTFNSGINKGHESTFNNGLNTGLSPTFISGPNVNQGSKFTRNSYNKHGSILNNDAISNYGNLNVGLNSAYKSNLNGGGQSFTSTYPSQTGTTSITSSTNTENQQTNSFSNNLTPTSFSLPNHRLTNGGNNNVKIVHIPVDTGSQSPQTIKLPISNNAKYKLLHIGRTKSNLKNPSSTSIPENVLTTVKQAEAEVKEVLDINKRYKIGGEYKDQVINQNDGINHANQKESTATITGNQYGPSYNNGYLYPASNNNYNNNRQYVTSDSQSSASSSTFTQDNSSKNLIPNNAVNSLERAESELNKILESVEEGKIEYNQILGATNSSYTAGGNQYYPATNTLQTYGNSYLPPSTSFSNSEATTSTIAGGTTQYGLNSYDNTYNLNYLSSKRPTDLTIDTWKDFRKTDNSPSEQATTGTAQSTDVTIPPNETKNGQHTTLNYVPNTYNNFNTYKPWLGSYPNYTSLNWQKPENNPTYSTSLGNAQDYRYPNSLPNYESNNPIYNAPPSNIAVSNAESSTTNTYKTPDWKLYENNAYIQPIPSSDTTKSTATASSYSESSSPPFSTFNYVPHGNSLYPQNEFNRGIYRYPSVYGPNYGQQPNIINSPTTDSPTDEYTGPTDSPTTSNNDQSFTLPLRQNDGTKQSPSDDSNIGTYDSISEIVSSQAESFAAVDGIASSSQTVSKSSYETADSKNRHDQNKGYQLYLTDSTDYPVDTVTNSPIYTENKQNSTLSYDTSYESNNSTNNILQYNSDNDSTQTKSSVENTNDEGLYSEKRHKYSSVHRKYYKNQSNNIQSQTTDSGDVYAVPNNSDSLENYELTTPKNNLTSSSGGDSTQTQSPISETTDSTQDLTKYENRDTAYSTTNNTDVTNSTTESQFEIIGHYNKPSRNPGGYHHRYPGGRHVPKNHQLNRRKHGPKYSIDKYTNSYHLTNLGNEQESTLSYSDTNYESNSTTDNGSLSNTEKPSADTSNDGTYDLIDNTNEYNVASYNNRSTTVERSQSDIRFEDINRGYYTNSKGGRHSLNNNNNADGDSLNKQLKNKHKGTKQNSTSVTKKYEYESEENTYTSEDQSVQTDNTKQIKTIKNQQYSEVDKDEITKEDSSSSTVIQKDSSTVTQKDTSTVVQKDTTSTDNAAANSGCPKFGIPPNMGKETPYTRAFEALIKILDSIEKLFGKREPAEYY